MLLTAVPFSVVGALCDLAGAPHPPPRRPPAGGPPPPPFSKNQATPPPGRAGDLGGRGNWGGPGWGAGGGRALAPPPPARIPWAALGVTRGGGVPGGSARVLPVARPPPPHSRDPPGTATLLALPLDQPQAL